MQFTNIVNVLSDNNINCDVIQSTISSNEIDIVLGRNYPDELMDQVYDILEEDNIDISNVSVCGEFASLNNAQFATINNGPQRF